MLPDYDEPPDRWPAGDQIPCPRAFVRPEAGRRDEPSSSSQRSLGGSQRPP